MTDHPGPEPVPTDLLRKELTEGSGRFVVIFSVILVWAMDTILSHLLISSGAVSDTLALMVDTFESISTVIFVIVSLGFLVALLKPYPRVLLPIAVTYMSFAVIQVIANVLSMVASAHVKYVSGLSSLWDVGAVYMMSVFVFMFVYMYLDVSTPGGAFVWPSRQGEPPPVPQWLDYLFISLNVNSTYGPTSEAVMSRPVKLVMAIQVMLAILMLTVLISRAVSATS